MRTLLEWPPSLFLPARGKRRADTAPAVQPAPTPVRRLVRTTRPAARIIDGDATALVRPFLVAHEKEQERQRQAERRVALALATMGIDFPGCAA